MRWAGQVAHIGNAFIIFLVKPGGSIQIGGTSHRPEDNIEMDVNENRV
jgi:hypothetical protein